VNLSLLNKVLVNDSNFAFAAAEEVAGRVNWCVLVGEGVRLSDSSIFSLVGEAVCLGGPSFVLVVQHIRIHFSFVILAPPREEVYDLVEAQ
jgi:hypothetical protein